MEVFCSPLVKVMNSSTEYPDGNEETMATAGQGEGDSITSAPVDESDPAISAPHSQRWTSTRTFAEQDKGI